MEEFSLGVSTSCLSYAVLRTYQLKGLRNGNWYRLRILEKAFYRACMIYFKVGQSIKSRRLASLLNEIIAKLKSTVKIKVLQGAIREIRRIIPIYLKVNVFEWAPMLVDWLREESFLMWLGIVRSYAHV